jgi:hypothetical protein
VDAPQWRKDIIAEVKAFLKAHGYRCSGAHFWKFVGDRRFTVQLMGGSLQHDTGRLLMWIYLGLDFVGISCELKEAKVPKAYLGMWSGQLTRPNALGIEDVDWTANSRAEALEIVARIKATLPDALATIERRFQTWHDLLAATTPNSFVTLNPLGKVTEYKLPKVF